MRHGLLLIGTLYQSAAVLPVAGDYGVVPCRVIGGSQAVVIARRWLPGLLAQWHELAGEGMQDLRMFRSVEDVFPWVYVAVPNLVQHQEVKSTWGGGSHTSGTFSPNWRVVPG